MNREELKQSALSATGPCPKAKGYLAPVDVLIEMGRLSRKDYEEWRLGRVRYLEEVISPESKQIGGVASRSARQLAQGRTEAKLDGIHEVGKRPAPKVAVYEERQRAAGRALRDALRETNSCPNQVRSGRRGEPRSNFRRCISS